MRKPARRPKFKSTKKVDGPIWSDSEWTVVEGVLSSPRGRPPKNGNLFRYVAEKIPFGCLARIKKAIERNGKKINGVYLAHDSMGVARYGGRGQIFTRLSKRHSMYPKEIVYFSFYVIEQKSHEREIETAILRAAGPQMILNTRKVRDGIDPGNIKDYEPGTKFFERQRRKGKKAAAKRAAP